MPNRSRQATDRAKAVASFGALGGACPTMQACSASSLIMPRPNTDRCRSGGFPKILLPRFRDKPSRGRPSAFPTPAKDRAGDLTATIFHLQNPLDCDWHDSEILVS